MTSTYAPGSFEKKMKIKNKGFKNYCFFTAEFTYLVSSIFKTSTGCASYLR